MAPVRKQQKATSPTPTPNMDQCETAQPGVFAQSKSVTPRLKHVDPQWNDNIPISKLPNEIFVQVVFISEPYRSQKTPNQSQATRPDLQGTICTWAPLMLVCRRWYDIICSTTLLWKDISVHNGLNWLRLSIHRSAPCLINLHFSSATTAAAALDTLLPPIADRLKKLTISLERGSRRPSPPTTPGQLSLLHVMHSLEELKITPQHTPGGSIFSSLPKGQMGGVMVSAHCFPALSSLELSGVDLPGFDQIVTVFPRLRVLHLSRCFFEKRVTFQGLLDAFSKCTVLRKLKLLDSLSHATDSPIQAPQRTVSLPTLDELFLYDQQPVVSAFMTYVLLSPDAYVHLIGDIVDPEVDQTSSFISLLPDDTSHLHAL